jgi:hypothetical protein
MDIVQVVVFPVEVIIMVIVHGASCFSLAWGATQSWLQSRHACCFRRSQFQM